MQSETKSRVDQLTSPAGHPVTALRFEGDIASTSKDAVLGSYQSLPKATAKLVLLDFHQGGLHQFERHRAGHPAADRSRELRPEGLCLWPVAALHQGLHHGGHHQVRRPVSQPGRCARGAVTRRRIHTQARSKCESTVETGQRGSFRAAITRARRICEES